MARRTTKTRHEWLRRGRKAPRRNLSRADVSPSKTHSGTARHTPRRWRSVFGLMGTSKRHDGRHDFLASTLPGPEASDSVKLVPNYRCGAAPLCLRCGFPMPPTPGGYLHEAGR
ncbi:hypothetical protein AKJ09_08873 [Labilithrix luteola]|uniref:Uncharacterized protein n=1 Tax=Labilithrix luteola TaxID=1391654 RepID=A0A0K1Q9Z3_9BACT|nr:hypothetical protein AKJ09_08873 [Labilithrix luteola]